MSRPILLVCLCVLVIVAVTESASASVVEQPREAVQVPDLVQEKEAVSFVKADDSDIEPAICKRKGFGCRKGKQCCSKRCVKKKCA